MHYWQINETFTCNPRTTLAVQFYSWCFHRMQQVHFICHVIFWTFQFLLSNSFHLSHSCLGLAVNMANIKIWSIFRADIWSKLIPDNRYFSGVLALPFTNTDKDISKSADISAWPIYCPWFFYSDGTWVQLMMTCTALNKTPDQVAISYWHWMKFICFTCMAASWSCRGCQILRTHAKL